MSFNELLVSPFAYAPPAQVLEGLTDGDAVRRLDGTPHTVAELHYTMHDALTHIAVHNAHHLGQVVVLRQMLGRWPPPAGSWTW